MGAKGSGETVSEEPTVLHIHFVVRLTIPSGN